MIVFMDAECRVCTADQNRRKELRITVPSTRLLAKRIKISFQAKQNKNKEKKNQE